MELFTTTLQALPNLPSLHRHTLLITNPSTKPSLLLRQFASSRASLRLRSRLLLVRATSSEDSVGNAYTGQDPDGMVSTYEVPTPGKSLYSRAEVEEAPQEDPTLNGGDGQNQISELLQNFIAKLDNDDAYMYLLYGSGALVTLWLASAIVGAIDSIPLFPKLMEVVGLGYTVWFSTRYLIFKKNREELVAKVQILKQQVLGSNED